MCISKEWGERNSWHFNKQMITPSFPSSKELFILFLRITSANIVVESILWEVWSLVPIPAHITTPPDSRMCGIISKLFPFPSPPATNLLPSSPLTTPEKCLHTAASPREKTDLDDKFPFLTQITPIFLPAHTLLPEIRFSTSDGSISQQQLFNNTGHSDYSQIYCEAA